MVLDQTRTEEGTKKELHAFFFLRFEEVKGDESQMQNTLLMDQVLQEEDGVSNLHSSVRLFVKPLLIRVDE